MPAGQVTNTDALSGGDSCGQTVRTDLVVSGVNVARPVNRAPDSGPGTPISHAISRPSFGASRLLANSVISSLVTSRKEGKVYPQ